MPTLLGKIRARKMGAMKKMCKQSHEWKKKKKNISIAQCIQILYNTTSKHLSDEYNEAKVKAWALFIYVKTNFPLH